MASAKALLGSVLGRFLFHDSQVTRVREVSRAFRQVDCEGPALRGQGWTPGDKVQVELTPYDLTRGRITYRFK